MTEAGFNFEGVGFWVARRAHLTGGRTAILYDGREIRYRELDARSNRAAAVLSGLGVGKGDRVAVLARNSPEYAEVFIACAKLGAIVVPLNWRLAPPELEFQVGDSGSGTIVYDAEFADSVSAIRPQTPIEGELVIGGERTGGYEPALAGSSDEPPEVEVSADDVLAIIYTSGTTGKPKGAMLTHGNFFWTNLN
ncbi:MAG: AMP-binding protein, partial [Actinomycetota bacterium]